MDAVRSLLLGGGLTVSTATGATGQSISFRHFSLSVLPSTSHRRFLRLTVTASPPSPLPVAPTQPRCSRWVVVMDDPPAPEGGGEVSRAEAVDYYVATLARVVGSEQDAQMCIYDASWDESYEFCCEIDEEASRELAKMPGVLAVRTVKGDESEKYNRSSSLPPANIASFNDAVNHSSSSEKSEFWLVQMEKPGVEVVTKAQMVDHYTQILMKVAGNKKDAQVSIYHVSWERDYGFYFHIDEECAKELADVPTVLSVLPDTNFGSDSKDYKEMRQLGIKPNGVTFVSILNACSHGGLVDEGFKYFSLMRSMGIRPSIQHHGCLVDLLGHVGFLEDAFKLASSRPEDPGIVTWSALLAACQSHDNVDMAEIAAQKVAETEPSHDSSYVLLSNTYACARQWKDLKRTRSQIDEHRMVKKPGLSWIEVNGTMHSFIMADMSHIESKHIYRMLEDLKLNLTSAVYEPERFALPEV